jgi:hypothetical protein
MSKFKSLALIVAVLSLLGAPLAAQMGMGMGFTPPTMNGVWNPVVGSGATYDMVDKNNQKNSISYGIVGTEDVNGQTGYWMQIVISTEKSGQVVMQDLMVKQNGAVTPMKMILQPAGRGPMEFSTNGTMMQMMQGRGGMSAPTPAKADIRESAEKVGTESVTTPAGTFSCDHWRNKDGSGDVWITASAGPWGLVKVTTPNSSMTLTKVVTDAKSLITGTPQNMDNMMNMGRGGRNN